MGTLLLFRLKCGQIMTSTSGTVFPVAVRQTMKNNVGDVAAFKGYHTRYVRFQLIIRLHYRNCWNYPKRAIITCRWKLP